MSFGRWVIEPAGDRNCKIDTMLTRKYLQIIVFAFVLGLMHVASFGQEPKDGETRSIPPEARARIDLYFDYYGKKDWAHLYEIDDWEIRNKEDYVAINTKNETSPYRPFRALNTVAFENTMFYYASSKNWVVSGCSRVIDLDGVEKLTKGSVVLIYDEGRGWLIRNLTITKYGDGFHPCDKKFTELPIQIKLSQ